MMTIRALLSEYGVPVSHRATVTAYAEAPDTSTTSVLMPEARPGVFEASITAVQSGVYRFRVVAIGSTWRGLPFTREQLVTGTAFAHGDDPYTISPPDTSGQVKELCALVECILKDLGPFLQERSINPSAILECVQAYCRKRLAPPSSEELAHREGTAPSQQVSALLSDPVLIAAIAAAVQRLGIS
jgi:hypothetical protein